MPQTPLTGQQKLGLSVFVVIGIATLFLGIMQIKKNVASPFVRNTDIKFRTPEEIEKANEDRLKALDTDGDSVNDFDELYVFRTSPYLEDSDSDGEPDGKEIAANSDPNCPKGKTCRQPKLESGAGSSTGSGTASGSSSGSDSPTGGTATSGVGSNVTPQQVEAATDIALQSIIATFGDPTKLTKEAAQAKIAAMTSDELHTFLRSIGVPDEAMAKTDDATLKRMLGETMVEVIAQSQPGE